MDYVSEKESELYMKDFEKAMQGKNFAMNVLKSIRPVLPILSEDNLCKMLAYMFDIDNIVMRRSYSVYMPNDDIRIYNLIQDELMKRQTGKVMIARNQNGVDMYFGIDPRKFFKK